MLGMGVFAVAMSGFGLQLLHKWLSTRGLLPVLSP
jgi:hypothetical protein